MSLRQALKRSLESGGGDRIEGPFEQSLSPGPVKKPRTTAPKPAAAPRPIPVAKPVPKPVAAPRPPPAPRPVIPKPPRAAPRVAHVAGVPQIELEEERDEDEDADEADGSDADSDEDRADAAAVAAPEASMPLKKRFAAHRQESALSSSGGRPSAPAAAAAAVAAPLPVEEGDDVDADDFDDGYGPDLYGDAEDRARLLAMTELQREKEISRRNERRLLGIQNALLQRQLRGGLVGKQAAAAPAQRKGVKAGAAGKGRGAAAAAKDRKSAAAAAAEGSDSDGDEEEDEDVKQPKRGAVRGGRGGRGARAPASRARGAASAGAGASASSGSSSGSSSSSSSSSSGSEDEKDGGGRVVGGRRLRRKAGGDGTDSGSSSSDNGEVSAAVRMRGAQAAGARGKAAAAAVKERERQRELFGESSGSEGEGRGGDSSMAAIRGRATGDDRRAGAMMSDDSETEYEDSDDGGAALAAVARPAMAGGPVVNSGGPSAAAAWDALLPAEERGKDATLADVNRLLLRRGRAIEALGTPFGSDIVRGAFIRFHHGPRTFRIARVVDMGIGAEHYDPWQVDGGAPARSDASTVFKTRRVLHYAFGSSDTYGAPAPLPRLIRVNELSNSSITAEELDVYRRRVADQARASRSPLDRLPTRGEVAGMLQRAEETRASAGFSGAAVSRRLEDADAFLEARLGQLHNLSLVHDQTLARIAAAQRRLAEAPPGSSEHKRAAHTAARLEARLERIAAEEARRKAAHHARERQRLTTGRDVSTLTNIINAKVEERNSKIMDELAAAARARTMAQQAALEEDNPFMRRRTAPTVLFRPVDLTAAPASEDAPAAAPPQQTPSVPAAAAGGDGLVNVVSEMLDSAGLPDAPVASAAAGAPSAALSTLLSPPTSGASPSLALPSALRQTPTASLAEPATEALPRKGISLTEFRRRKAAEQASTL